MCFHQAWQHMFLYHLSTCAEGSLGSHVKSKPVVFMKHVAVRGQLQGLVTAPFTLSIITPKNKMTGFCLFVLGCGKIGLRISYMLSKHFIRPFIMQETCVF